MPDQVDWRALEREASPGRAVGRLLRDQREARGLTLNDIEKTLRIRVAHLQAIEEGRFDLLPGAAYVPAFLRAYAVHVGLDAAKVMNAYHLSGAVPIKRPVAMPADFPVVDRRAPIGLAVLTVLLVIAAGYAAWQYLPREQTVVAEKVPPVPDRLLALRPASPPPSEAAPTQTPASTASAPASANSTSELANRGVPDPKRAAAPQAPPVAPNVWPGRRESVAPPTQAQTQEVPLAPPVVVAVPVPPPPPAVMNAPAIGQAQAAQPPAPPDPPRSPQQPAAPVEEAKAPAAEAPPPPPAIAPVKVDTPVRVRANSWVELRGPNGDILAQTYVRAGESYVVPAGIAYRVIDAR